MRLIDGDELWERLNYEPWEHNADRDEIALPIVNAAPTVDAVPVVRCKDCIRRYDTDECPMCFLIEGNYCEYTNENGFCDRGERKEGADNG